MRLDVSLAGRAVAVADVDVDVDGLGRAAEVESLRLVAASCLGVLLVGSALIIASILSCRGMKLQRETRV